MIRCAECYITLWGGNDPLLHFLSRCLQTFICIVPFLCMQHQMKIFFPSDVTQPFVFSIRTINVLYFNVWTEWQWYFFLLGFMSCSMLCYIAICDLSLATSSSVLLKLVLISNLCILGNIMKRRFTFKNNMHVWVGREEKKKLNSTLLALIPIKILPCLQIFWQ